MSATFEVARSPLTRKSRFTGQLLVRPRIFTTKPTRVPHTSVRGNSLDFKDWVPKIGEFMVNEQQVLSHPDLGGNRYIMEDIECTLSQILK